MSRGNVIEVLQAGRAIAALAVVYHHAAAYTDSFATGLPQWARASASFGYLGVDFFFVLSGFIMAHIHRGDRNAGGYWRSRIERIFIPYLPVGLGIAALYTLLPGVSAGTREWSWVATATLLPGAGQPALIVAWTLQHELLFYAIFGVGLLIGRPLATVAAWAMVVGVYNLGFGAPPPALDPFLNWINVEFLFGMVAANMTRHRRSKLALPAALIVLAAYVALGAEPGDRVVFALATALLIVQLVRAEASGAIRIPAPLVFLGAASYAIYLVHNPVQSVTARLFDAWTVVLIAALVFGTAAGIMFHLLYERPVAKWFKSRRRSARAATMVAVE